MESKEFAPDMKR